MIDVKISGLGSYLPQNIVSNQKLFESIKNWEVETAIKSLEKKGHQTSNLAKEDIFDLWVKQVTGISSRTYLKPCTFEDQDCNAEYMAKEASLKAVADAGIETTDIEHIIFSSYTADSMIPSPVCGLINLLDLNGISGISLNGACSGFLDALVDGYLKIKSGAFKTILVAASEFISDKINFGDPTTAILFSDGAGACVLQAGDQGIYGFCSKINYNNEHISMQRKSNIKMAGGPLVQRKAVNAMHSVSTEALDNANIDLSEIKQIIPHQANVRILDSLEKKFKISDDVTLVKCLSQTGNLSSATVPVAMDLFKHNKLKNNTYSPNSKTILASVGGGYTYSSVIVDF